MKETQINEEIRDKEVRVVTDDGEQLARRGVEGQVVGGVDGAVGLPHVPDPQDRTGLLPAGRCGHRRGLAGRDAGGVGVAR